MPTTIDRKPLGQLLLDKGVVRLEHLTRALEEQRRSNHQKLLGEVLVELQICTEDQIVECLAVVYGVPYARVTANVADPKIVSILPREFLEKHQVLPLFLVDGVLTVAVPEPANVFLIEEIERASGHSVQVVAATTRDILSTLRSFLPDAGLPAVGKPTPLAKSETISIDTTAPGSPQIRPTAADTPVGKLVQSCIKSAVEESASDIHFEPLEDDLRIRFRIDGRLVEKQRCTAAMKPAVATRIKALARLNVTDCRSPQEGTFRLVVEDRPVDLRVSTVPGRHGESVVVHITDPQKSPANLEKLGFGYDNLKTWRKLIAARGGLLLVTGPVGGGKRTTLHASLAELNHPEFNLCAIEDPIESGLPGVNQFQVNESAGFGYAAAVRAMLRQDPDVLLVGEICDGETGRLATQAALAGYLVMSTLHTTDAPSAFARMHHLGVEPHLLGASVTGVLAQRLVRKLCPSCKEPYTPGLTEKRQLEKAAGLVETLYRPRGCVKCNNAGFSGRVGLFELLVVDAVIADCVSQGAPMKDLREHAKRAGMKTLLADGIEKVRLGITTLDEVYRVGV